MPALQTQVEGVNLTRKVPTDPRRFEQDRDALEHRFETLYKAVGDAVADRNTVITQSGTQQNGAVVVQQSSGYFEMSGTLTFVGLNIGVNTYPITFPRELGTLVRASVCILSNPSNTYQTTVSLEDIAKTGATIKVASGISSPYGLTISWSVLGQ